MRKQLENRWFTKTGKAKRIPAALEPFRQWANDNKKHFSQSESSPIYLTASIRTKYSLNLADAVNLMVYLVGCYSNGSLFSSERYGAGKIVAESLTNKAFDIRKLDLIK